MDNEHKAIKIEYMFAVDVTCVDCGTHKKIFFPEGINADTIECCGCGKEKYISGFILKGDKHE